MKLSKEALRFALKALRDIGATAEEIIPVRAAGTADDVMRVAAKAAGRIKQGYGPHYPDFSKFRSPDVINFDTIFDEAVADRELFDWAANTVRNKFPVGFPHSAPHPHNAERDVALDAFDTFKRMAAEKPMSRDIVASGASRQRLQQQRPDAIRILDTAMRSPLEQARSAHSPTSVTRSLLTANQLAKHPESINVVNRLVDVGAPQPLVAAREFLKSGLTDVEQELAARFIADGMDINDAIQVAKSLS